MKRKNKRDPRRKAKAHRFIVPSTGAASTAWPFKHGQFDATVICAKADTVQRDRK